MGRTRGNLSEQNKRPADKPVYSTKSAPILKADVPAKRIRDAADSWDVAPATGAARMGRQLEYLHEKRRIITYSQFAAGVKYRLHWHRGGLEAGIRTVDFNRTGGGPNGLAGMPATEDQVHHRRQWRQANDWIGQRGQIVLETVGCEDDSLEQAGYKLGEKNKPQAIAAARQILLGALDKLCDEWGI